MVIEDEINIQESRINQKSSNIMLVMFYKGATFVKNNSFLVARIVLFDAAGLYLLTFHISEPCLFKNIELDLSHVISH